MEIEDNLSDASLVEEEDEEDEIIDYPEPLIENSHLPPDVGDLDLEEMEESEAENSQLDHELEMDLPDAEESLLYDQDEDPDFHGFTEADMEQSTQAATPSGDMDYNKNVNFPFPKNMADCSGHYAAPVPFYKVHWAAEKTKVAIEPPKVAMEIPKVTMEAPKVCMETPKIAEEKVVTPKVNIDKVTEEEKKVKPLKIKKSSISTPSPMLQRESREWKPSSQFFKPLTAGLNSEIVIIFRI